MKTKKQKKQKYNLIDKDTGRIIKSFEKLIDAQIYCEDNAVDYDYFEIS